MFAEDYDGGLYVKRAGHCAISPEETTRGFNQLREWKTKGARPLAGAAR